jgi:hypothetical protein
MRTRRFAAALSLAGAISLASLPVQAAPLTALSAAAKPVAQDSNAIQVRWGGWHGGWGGWHGGGWGFGIGALAAGALIGAAIASPYYGAYPYYGYGYPYGYPYGYATTYYPTYSYSYYRPYRHVYVVHRPFWRHSYAMYRVHPYYRHYRR